MPARRPGRPTAGRSADDTNPKGRSGEWKKNPDRCAESADLFTNPRNDLSGIGRKRPFPRTKTAEIAGKRPFPVGNRPFFDRFRAPRGERFSSPPRRGEGRGEASEPLRQSATMRTSRRRSPEWRTWRRVHRDVGSFSAYGLHRPLRPYQLEAARAIAASVLDHQGLTFTVVFPRQAGKNELSAHLEAFLLRHYRWKGGSIVKAAPTFRPQVVHSILRLEQLLGEPLTDCSWHRVQGFILRLERASCSFYSAQPTANVVGATASLLLEGDEAQDLDQQKWDKDLSPMAASGAATRVLYGTPWTDDTLLGVNGVRQPCVGRPRPPERGEHEYPAADPCERRVVGEQRRDLREREHEDEVEEELPRRDAVLVFDGRDAHLSRPYSGAPAAA